MGAVSAVMRGAVPDFLNGDGYGNGYGYGDGYGYGYGDGYGYGNGYGYGYGNGYGDGDGYGNGYGYGDGYGYGNGYGYGDGDGYGYGYGYGDYWRACLKYFLAKLSAPAQQRAAQLLAKGIKLAYWRSTQGGAPANNGTKIEAAAPGVVHKVSGPLEICTSRALHATLIPPKWKGERWWIVAMHGDVVGDDEKCACLEREILGECV